MFFLNLVFTSYLSKNLGIFFLQKYQQHICFQLRQW